MPALVVALVIALTTAAGSGAVYASQDALPGDTLYQVKTTVEDLQLPLAVGDEAKARFYLDLATKRVAEVQQASASGRAYAAIVAAEAFAQNVANAEQHLDRAVASGKDVETLATMLQSNLARQQSTLEAARDRVDNETAKAAIAKAAEKAQTGLNTATERIENATAGRSDDVPPAPAVDAPAKGKPVNVPAIADIPDATPADERTELQQLLAEIRGRVEGRSPVVAPVQTPDVAAPPVPVPAGRKPAATGRPTQVVPAEGAPDEVPGHGPPASLRRRQGPPIVVPAQATPSPTPGGLP